MGGVKQKKQRITTILWKYLDIAFFSSIFKDLSHKTYWFWKFYGGDKRLVFDDNILMSLCIPYLYQTLKHINSHTMNEILIWKDNQAYTPSIYFFLDSARWPWVFIVFVRAEMAIFAQKRTFMRLLHFMTIIHHTNENEEIGPIVENLCACEPLCPRCGLGLVTMRVSCPSRELASARILGPQMKMEGATASQ